MTRRDKRPQYGGPCPGLAVGKDRFWKFKKRALEAVNDIGLENGVIFSWAVGIGKALRVRKSTCVPRGQICSNFVVGSRV